jgi:hypothetical protein
VLTAIALGFALGIRHAADPDHVAALAALAARHRRVSESAWLGAVWGLGHSLTLLAVGGGIVALRIAVPRAWAGAAELAVAGVLVVLGISNLRAVRRGDGGASSHRHEHPYEPRKAGVGRRGALRALGVGIVHGLAGTAAVALLALAAMPTIGAALLYLAVFGMGTVGGMIALSFGLGLPLALAGGRARATRWLLAGSGLVSIGVGVAVAVAVGVETFAS